MVRSSCLVSLASSVVIVGAMAVTAGAQMQQPQTQPPTQPQRQPQQPQQQGALSQEARETFMNAVTGSMMEVELGRVAQQKAQSPEVKEFASKMVTDHQRLLTESRPLAQQKNITLPVQMKTDQQEKMEKMSKMSGAEFDRAYMKEMVIDHTRALAQLEKSMQQITDPQMKQWAQQTQQTLKQHHEQAKQIAQKVGVDVQQAEQEARQMSTSGQQPGAQQQRTGGQPQQPQTMPRE